MTLHLQYTLDLHQVDLLSVPKANNLIEGAEKLKCVSRNFPLVDCAATHIGNDASEEMQGFVIL